MTSKWVDIGAAIDASRWRMFESLLAADAMMTEQDIAIAKAWRNQVEKEPQSATVQFNTEFAKRLIDHAFRPPSCKCGNSELRCCKCGEYTKGADA